MFRRRLAIAALAVLLLVQPARERVPIGGGGSAFDRLYAELDRDPTLIMKEARWRQIERLATLLPPDDARRRLQLDALACPVWRKQLADAEVRLTSALQRARAAGNRTAETRLLVCRAEIEELTHGAQAALPHFQAAVALGRQLEQRQLLAEMLPMRGNIFSLLGDNALALQDMLEAQQLFDALGLTAAAESNLYDIAVAYRRMGELDRALDYLDQAGRFAERIDDDDLRVSVWLNLGHAHIQAGRPEPALTAFQRTAVITRIRPWAFERGMAALGIAGSLVQLRRYPEALVAVADARRYMDEAQVDADDGMIELVTGQARAGLGDSERALSHFARAEQAFTGLDNLRYLELLYTARAPLLERMGRHAQALDDLRRLRDARERLQGPLQDQRLLVARHGFDAQRSQLQQVRLLAVQRLQSQQLQALRHARLWQRGALAIGAILAALLVTLLLRQIRHSQRLRRMGLTDELTRLPNRRAIEQLAAQALARHRRHGLPLTVLMLDIDHFKQINDRLGHACGDDVLVRVAQACAGAIRQHDKVGRVGGEEFLVVLPGSRDADARHVAERLRAAVQQLRFEDLNAGLQVTVSVGLAQAEAASTLPDLLQRADAALYRAKRLGRNRVEVAEYDAPIDPLPEAGVPA